MILDLSQLENGRLEAAFRIPPESPLLEGFGGQVSEPIELGVSVRHPSGDAYVIDAVLTGSHSRYQGLPDGQDFVPGALESSGELGASAIFPEFNVSARLRYLGPHPLIEDNSLRGEATLLANIRAAWTPKQVLGMSGWELNAEVLNVFDSMRHDIDYFYATRLPGEPLEGIEDFNSRVVEPRQLRVGVKKTF